MTDLKLPDGDGMALVPELRLKHPSASTVVITGKATVETAVDALRDGELVAFPTETVYGLGANASNPAAVRKVFELKGRPPSHPVIVHIDERRYLKRWVRELSTAAEQLAVAVAPIYLVAPSFSSRNAWEPLLGTGCAILLVRLLDGADPRLGLAFGLLAGIGLLNKHTMGLFGAGAVLGLLSTARGRALFRSRWIWVGAAAAFLVFGLDKLRAIVRRTNETHPDIVLLAGDYVIGGVKFGTYVTPEAIGEALSGLKAPLGTWAVLGNHDYGQNAPRIEGALRRARTPVARLEEEPHMNPSTGTLEFSLRDPDGYYVTISALSAV